MKREVNHVTVRSGRIQRPLTLALVPDLHDGPFADVEAELAASDAILIVGDLVDRHSGGYLQGVEFLRHAPDLAPTFYAIGNHERKFKRPDLYWPHVEQSRVRVLDNEFVEFGGVALGALSSVKGTPDTAFLARMEKQESFRLLMCHHPEYFPKYVCPFDIDLTVSGHCHGGQVRIGRQGVYAPGQGLLPRLTSGFYFDGRLLVSRGMTNATWAPRINCNTELILLHLEPEA